VVRRGLPPGSSSLPATWVMKMGDTLMASVDNDETVTEGARFCPGCGQPCGSANFCRSCGHEMGFPNHRTLTHPAPQSPPADGQKPRARKGLIIAGVILGVVAAAIAVIVLINNGSSGRHSGSSTGTTAGTTASAAYERQLTKVLAPMITSNQTLSSSLTALNGSKQSTKTAKTSTSQALAALAGARGGLGVLSAPPAQSTLSEQVQQALTADSGYLQAVSATLATPSGAGAGQLQTLATGAQSALDPLTSVASGASASISGTDNLVSWAQGASAHAHQSQKTAPPVTTSSTVQSSPPPTTPGASSGMSACDQNISVNADTSCSFADIVFSQYANVVQANGGPTSAEVTATSPVTGSTYTDSCQYTASNGTVSCSHGTDLIQFPESAAAVYDG
jgi:hypothetical protein